MSVRHLSYVSCDVCDGHPAQPGDTAAEARGIARTEGYTIVNGQDVCGRCSGTVDRYGLAVKR